MHASELSASKPLVSTVEAKDLQMLRCLACEEQRRNGNTVVGCVLGPDSYDLAQCFLHLLKEEFGTEKVHVNTLYEEYIKYPTHIDVARR